MKQIIYSKFSNERNYRFAIRTDICEDEKRISAACGKYVPVQKDSFI